MEKIASVGQLSIIICLMASYPTSIASSETALRKAARTARVQILAPAPFFWKLREGLRSGPISNPGQAAVFSFHQICSFLIYVAVKSFPVTIFTSKVLKLEY